MEVGFDESLKKVSFGQFFETLAEASGLFPSEEKSTGPQKDACPPAVLPDSSDEEDFPDEELCQPEFINDKVGNGMAAAKDIGPGDVVFAERVIWTTPDEEEEWQNPKKGNRLIGDRVKALGPIFTQNYMQLPNQHPELGKFAGIYKTNQLPIRWMGKDAWMLGCRLSFVNHSCAPNAALILKNRRMIPTPDGKATPAGIRYAVVQALVPIPKAAEITVSYVYTSGITTARKVSCVMHLGFSCQCLACSGQTSMLDKTLARCRRFDSLFQSEENIVERPSRLFWIAGKIMIGCAFTSFFEKRIIPVLMKCGMLAAFHSDKARAYAFIEKAKLMAWMLDGPNGYFFPLLAAWYEDIEKIPGYGSSNRGHSELEEVKKINEDKESNFDIMFMLDSKPYEYARVSQYRRVFNKDGKPNMEIIRTEEEEQKIREHSSAARRKRKRRRRAQSDDCNDPELDFFDCYRRAVIVIFSEMMAKEENDNPKVSKNTDKGLDKESFQHMPTQRRKGAKKGRTRAKFPDPKMVRVAFDHLGHFKEEIQRTAPTIIHRRAFQGAIDQANGEAEEAGDQVVA